MQIYIMRMLKHCNLKPKPRSFKIKFMYSEKATEFEKNSHSNLKLLGTIDQKIMWPSQN